MKLKYNKVFKSYNRMYDVLHEVGDEMYMKYHRSYTDPVMKNVFYQIYGEQNNNGFEFDLCHFIRDITP